MEQHATEDKLSLAECSQKDTTEIKEHSELDPGTTANSPRQTIESSVKSPVPVNELDDLRIRTENVSSAVNSDLNTRFRVESAVDGQFTSPGNTSKQLDNLHTSGNVPGEIQPDSTSSLPQTSSQVPENGHGNLRSLNQCSGPKPSNRAVVVLQGQLSKNYLEQIEQSFRRMGYDRPEIFHKASDSITRHEFERKAASLMDDLKSVSNLLLVICQGEYGGIELNTNFLIQQIYRPVASFNRQKEEEFKAAVKLKQRPYPGQFEGINLTVLLDGVDACSLKYYVKYKDSKAHQSEKPKFKWCKSHAFDHQKSRVIDQVIHGNIVQFWVRRNTYGHSPFLLLDTFIESCREEEHMNYLTFLQQIRSKLYKKPELITPLFSVRNVNCSNVRGDRFIEGASYCVAKWFLKQLIKVIKRCIRERNENRIEKDTYRGDFILSSMCKFDFCLMLK